MSRRRIGFVTARDDPLRWGEWAAAIQNDDSDQQGEPCVSFMGARQNGSDISHS
jgi:hypothetical protein